MKWSRETLERFINGEMIVDCKTNESAKTFLQKLKDEGHVTVAGTEINVDMRMSINNGSGFSYGYRIKQDLPESIKKLAKENNIIPSEYEGKGVRRCFRNSPDIEIIEFTSWGF